MVDFGIPIGAGIAFGLGALGTGIAQSKIGAAGAGNSRHSGFCGRSNDHDHAGVNRETLREYHMTKESLWTVDQKG
jgi:hypothetical protein